MEKQPFSLSDDDYDCREENKNIRYANILRINPVKIDNENDNNSHSNRSSDDDNSRGIDFSDGEGTAKHEKEIEKMPKGC